MTPSQWALAEYDRLHASQIDGAADGHPASMDHVDPSARDGSADIRLPDDQSLAEARNSGVKPASRARKWLPYAAAVGAFVLGVAVTGGVEAAVGPRSPRSSTSVGVPTSAGGVSASQPGQGDEGATLVAVSRYFASAPKGDDLSADVARGFDTASFHLVTGRANAKDGTAVYAARRLDGEYCLVVVADAGRTAETCGTLDDIARRGLSLTADTTSTAGPGAVAVTVTWATDGTISWTTGASAG
ncbi:hypothetical protein GCM10028798_23080 [Humibacter antri]